MAWPVAPVVFLCLLPRLQSCLQFCGQYCPCGEQPCKALILHMHVRIQASPLMTVCRSQVMTIAIDFRTVLRAATVGALVNKREHYPSC